MHIYVQITYIHRAGKMDLKVEGPRKSEKYCWPPWLADKENF